MAAINFSLSNAEDEFTALYGSFLAEDQALPTVTTDFILVDLEDAFAFLLEQIRLLAQFPEGESLLVPAVALI